MLTMREGGIFRRRATGIRRIRRYQIDYETLDHLHRYPGDARRLLDAIASAHGREFAEAEMRALLGYVP